MYIRLFGILLLLLSLTHASFAQVCSASVAINPQQGSWEEAGEMRRVFDLTITNNGVCSFTAATVDVSLPAGARMGASWGYSVASHVVSGFGVLTAGQTYQGTGFIVSGHGLPSAKVVGYANCVCPSASTTGSLNSQDPGTTTTGGGGLPTDSPIPTGPSFSLGLKFLVMTCTAADPRYGAIVATLEAVGAPYDVIIYETYGIAPLNLSPGNVAKYTSIIAATELACWDKSQVIEIEAYEIAFSSKTVIMYSYPYATNGVTLRSQGPVALGKTVVYATLTSEFASMVPFLKSGIQIPVTGVSGYPSTISNSNLATPAIYVTVDGTQYVAAAFINYGNRRRLEFYFDQADWAIASSIWGSAWLQWVSNGVFAGIRRIEFNAHIDDIFMATGMFDLDLGTEGKTLYRITSDDLISVKDWQRTLNARLPAGSSFVLTFPFNGYTVVVEKGGYAGDALYQTAKQYRDEFFWESHTYTHPYLDNYSYAQVKAEWDQNVPTALDLYNNDLTNPTWCQKSVVTPSITGLFNGEALRAMWDVGIRYVVGDNSRPELVSTNPYHGMYTTKIPNGFDGMFIVPRHATNIYYDGSQPQDIVSQYNFKYQGKIDHEYTFDEVVAADVDVAVKNMLFFRHDPFMFHQANLRKIDVNGKDTSLVGYWVDAVVDELMKYTSLPIMSHTHDDLAEMYLSRIARDACGVTASMKIDENTLKIVGISLTSTGSCEYPISGAVVSQSANVRYETYGSEKTSWITLTPNTPVELTFSSAVPVL